MVAVLLRKPHGVVLMDGARHREPHAAARGDGHADCEHTQYDADCDGKGDAGSVTTGHAVRDLIADRRGDTE